MRYNSLFKTMLVLVAAVATSLAGNAQALNVTLDECIRIALNDNPSIIVADMEIKRVDYSKKQTLGQLFPQVNFTANYNRTLAKQTMVMMDQEFKVGTDNQHSVGFQGSLPIIVPSLWKSIKLSDNQILQNIENARASRLSLVNEVKNAYYALLLARDSKRVIERNHETALLTADIFKKQYEIGVASEYDMTRAHVAATTLEPSILDAENSITALKLQLKVLMGMDVGVDIEPVETLDDFKTQMYENTLNTDTSLVNNTNVRQLDLQTEYLQQALKVQKMSWFPTLNGTINYMWNSMSNGSPFKNFNWNPYSQAGLALTWNLFSGGQRYYKQKQAEIAVREMKWQRENLTRGLSSQVQTQLNSIKSNLKQIESNAASVALAEKSDQIIQESFRLGVGTFLQIQDTQNALLGARLSYYQAIYNLLVAQSNLEFTLGNAPLHKYGVQTETKQTK
ncbi:MAG: TolC family protein [Muribaculaceae bacterium]|nr:TolC family protein [Muribaculaceae bacterium]